MKGGRCVPECEECTHNKDGFCSVFVCPEAKFRIGRGSCGMATHMVTRVTDEGKKRVGQQKSKAMRKNKG